MEMKIVLSLALIAVGIHGLIMWYIRRSKEKKEILKRLIANHIMAENAFNELKNGGKMSSEVYFERMNHLIDNTFEIVAKACGTKYIVDADWLLKKYGKNPEKQRVNESQIP